ncbi:MAG: hypothetical protein JRJ29_17530, partial [Deltaproteobacteria bacterium]|nr:hypothetical protein [Deltaproteobacteria bacterium]
MKTKVYLISLFMIALLPLSPITAYAHEPVGEQARGAPASAFNNTYGMMG